MSSDKATQTLQVLQTVAGDMRPVWDAVHQTVCDEVEGVFQREGPGWQALSTAYRRRKRGPSILHETGRLRRSWTRPEHALHHYRADATTAEVGSNDPNAARHQQGRGNLPIREIWLDAAAEDRIAAAVERAIADLLQEG